MLLDAVRSIAARGLAPATSGNFSVRLNKDSFCITQSGCNKSAPQAKDLMTLDLEGRELTHGKPSAEWRLHAELYRLYPDAGAVLHAHSVASTMLSLAHQSDKLVLSGYELLKAYEGVDTHEAEVTIPIINNDQDVANMARDVTPLLRNLAQPYAYLIRGHGFYAWGRDLDAALRHLDATEFLLQCLLYSSKMNA